MSFLLHWLVVGLSLWFADYLITGVRVDSGATLLIAALVLGLVNAIVRPVLTIITLPLTILTLGLFYLVVNGVAFMLASMLVPGFSVDSFGSAVLGALVVSIVSWIIGGILGGRER